MPPITPVPMSFWLAAPAAVATASGATPAINAIDVIRIGRSRNRAAPMAASKALSPRRTPCPGRSRKRRERHHTVRRVADRPIVEIGWHHAVRRIAFDIDALHAAAIDEVVHEQPGPCRGERVVDIAETKPKCRRLAVV